MMCCGAEHGEVKFCPYCGQKAQAAFQGLLRHVRLNYFKRVAESKNPRRMARIYGTGRVMTGQAAVEYNLKMQAKWKLWYEMILGLAEEEKKLGGMIGTQAAIRAFKDFAAQVMASREPIKVAMTTDESALEK